MIHHKILYNPDKLFFTSDHHFSHSKIIDYCDRPFENVHEMNNELIRRWNEKIPHNGIVFYLGDFAWGRTTNAQYLLTKLNGTKHLIIGNHDKTVLKKEYTKELFASIQYYAKIRVEDKEINKSYQEICLMHYPILNWDNIRQGSWHLFGHTHDSLLHHKTHGLTSNLACLDVGVDCEYSNYTPLSYYEIKEIILEKIK